MLTRLRIRGFKNLVDVDVRFAPTPLSRGACGGLDPALAATLMEELRRRRTDDRLWHRLT